MLQAFYFQNPSNVVELSEILDYFYQINYY